jgi:hypothetical protein
MYNGEENIAPQVTIYGGGDEIRQFYWCVTEMKINPDLPTVCVKEK